jgi:hypothetical protein
VGTGDVPDHYEINTEGNVSYYYEWKTRTGFSGKPVRFEVYSLSEDGSVWFNNIESGTDCFVLNTTITVEGASTYRLEFEFQSNAAINIHIHQLDVNRVFITEQDIEVIRSNGIELRSYELTPTENTKKLDIYFQVDHAHAPVSFTIGQIRLNEKTGEDEFFTSNIVSPFTIDNILRTLPEDIYDISLDSLIYNFANAIATEFDIARTVIFTVLDYFFLDYAVSDRLDSFGTLLDVPRVLAEQDKYYRQRLKAKLTAAFGGGVFSVVRQLLAVYTRGSEPLVEAKWTWNEVTEIYEPSLEVTLAMDCKLLLTEDELLVAIQDITTVGIPVKLITPVSGEWADGVEAEYPAEYDLSTYGGA